MFIPYNFDEDNGNEFIWLNRLKYTTVPNLIYPNLFYDLQTTPHPMQYTYFHDFFSPRSTPNSYFPEWI